MLDEDTDQDQPNWVQPCPPDFELKNWQIIEQPEIYVFNLM